MKILLLNDTESNYHWGCTATSAALKAGILKQSKSLTSIPITATKGWSNVPTTKEGFESQKQYEEFCEKKENAELIQKLKVADIIVINGEGTIHGGLRPSPLKLLYIAYISKVFLKKNVQIVNHGVQIVDCSTTQYHAELCVSENEAQKIYQMVYEKLDFIAARDKQSYDLAKIWNSSNTKQSFDCLPLYIAEHFKYKAKSSSKTIVIAGSVAWKQDAIPHLVEYIKTMIEKGYKIKILIGAKENPAADDKTFLEAISNCLPQNNHKWRWNLVNANTLQEWLDTIHSADLLVSGRFHHSIAAVCLKTPFVTLNSNTDKITALTEIFELPPPIRYDDKALLEKLKIQTETRFKAYPKDHLKKLCEQAKQNFLGISSYKARVDIISKNNRNLTFYCALGASLLAGSFVLYQRFKARNSSQQPSSLIPLQLPGSGIKPSK